MTLNIDAEFKSICRNILEEDKNDTDWALIESDDQFQTQKYCGGYDATESGFCFSYYTNDQEYWFQLSLKDIEKIMKDNLHEINIRIADK